MADLISIRKHAYCQDLQELSEYIEISSKCRTRTSAKAEAESQRPQHSVNWVRFSGAESSTRLVLNRIRCLKPGGPNCQAFGLLSSSTAKEFD
jgi:hypothetical protein